MIAVPKLGPIPAPHTFHSLFGRTAESRVWPIRHWGGEAHSNPLVYQYRVFNGLPRRWPQQPQTFSSTRVMLLNDSALSSCVPTSSSWPYQHVHHHLLLYPHWHVIGASVNMCVGAPLGFVYYLV